MLLLDVDILDVDILLDKSISSNKPRFIFGKDTIMKKHYEHYSFLYHNGYILSPVFLRIFHEHKKYPYF